VKFTKLEIVKSKSTLSQILTAALDKAATYFGETIVIKISGSLLLDNNKLKEIVKNIISLRSIGMNIFIIHGGFDQVQNIIGNNEHSRKTTASKISPIETIEMVMTGYFAKNIANMINFCGGHAIIISGKEGRFIEAKKSKRSRSSAKIENILDIGYMGEIEMLNPDILFEMEESCVIPVISPIAFSETGETYQVNADVLAMELAKLYSAIRLVYLCDSDPIKNSKNEHIKTLTMSEARKFVDSEKLNEKLATKINCCINAVEEGVEEGLIIPGWFENVLMIDLFSDENIGTKIVTNANVT